MKLMIDSQNTNDGSVTFAGGSLEIYEGAVEIDKEFAVASSLIQVHDVHVEDVVKQLCVACRVDGVFDIQEGLTHQGNCVVDHGGFGIVLDDHGLAFSLSIDYSDLSEGY